MAVRLVVTFHAVSGKGAELAQAMKARCEVSRQDAGCEHFEVFQSVSDPDKLVLLELWKDRTALDAHAKLQAQRPPLPEGLRLGAGERGLYLQPHPLNGGGAKMQVSYFETGRYYAPSNLPRQWPMPAGAYDREAG
jgi:quinol monooxygenase YgiN